MLIHTRDGKTFSPRLTDEPTTSLVDGVGYGQATVPCVVPDHDIRGAIVQIDTADPWFGIVTDAPPKSDVLQAIGFGVVGTHQRRQALYCNTRVSDWRETRLTGRSQDIMLQPDVAALNFVWSAGVAYGAAVWNAWIIEFPRATSATAITFDWARSSTNYDLRVQLMTAQPAGNNGEFFDFAVMGGYDYGSASGTSGSVSLSSATANVVGIMIQARNTNSIAGLGSPNTIRLSNLKVYGEGVTSVTTTNLLTDMLAKYVDPYYLPAGRLGFIATEATSVEPFPKAGGVTLNALIDELQTEAAYRFGWYTERVGGALVPCPHWEAIPTTPSYVLDLDDAIGEGDIEYGSFDALVSAVDLGYRDAEGRTIRETIYDTDATHRLVQLGMNTAATAKARELDVDTQSATKARALAATALSHWGRDQVRGRRTWAKVRDMTGQPVPASRVRPNRLVRLLGLERPVDVMVREVQAVGDSLATISLDNDSYALDVALAHLETTPSTTIPLRWGVPGR